MKKVIKKVLYKIEFELASALSIGSGDNYNTDKDIIIGSNKKPYIPASAIAGVCISMLDGNKDQDEKKYKDYWGYIKKASGDNKDALAEESRIIFYDATILEGKDYVTFRDSVALDEYKTSNDVAKFDMEVLEPGVRFVTYIEQSFHLNDDIEIAKMIASYFKSGDIFFGGKTSRGYGAITNVSVSSYHIDFQNDSKEKIEEWAASSLDELDWIDDEKLEYEFGNEVYKEKKIKLSLKQEGGISIRKYVTKPSTDETTEPDFTQLITSGENEKPVIPGTSWAGAFEHQMIKYLGSDIKSSDEWKTLFGYVDGPGKSKSKIRFGESMISESEPKKMSRNSIDRFTGGTVEGALFTEVTYYGGKTDLVIGINESITLTDEFARALAASIVDLHYGFMAVGGETSIGRGLFSITKIEGISSVPKKDGYADANDFYQNVYSLLKSNRESESNG